MLGTPGPSRRTRVRTSQPKMGIGPHSLDGAYHIPHNVAFPDEFHLLLRNLAWTGPVGFRDIVAHLFEEQVKRDHFRFFHPKPHEYFTNHCNPADLSQLTLKLGSRSEAEAFALKRVQAFAEFEKKAITTDEFLDSAYKPGRSWRQVWVEYPRDYLDFAVMLKLAVGGSTTRCEIAQRGSRYLNDPTTLDEALLELVISVGGKKEHTIRPFWLTLALLDGAHRKGVYAVETRRLMKVVSHLSGEDQYPEALREVLASRAPDKAEPGRAKNSKEAQRFSLPVRRFLEHRDLAREAIHGKTKYLSITRRGRLLVGSSW